MNPAQVQAASMQMRQAGIPQNAIQQGPVMANGLTPQQIQLLQTQNAQFAGQIINGNPVLATNGNRVMGMNLFVPFSLILELTSYFSYANESSAFSATKTVTGSSCRSGRPKRIAEPKSSPDQNYHDSPRPDQWPASISATREWPAYSDAHAIAVSTTTPVSIPAASASAAYAGSSPGTSSSPSPAPAASTASRPA